MASITECRECGIGMESHAPDDTLCNRCIDEALKEEINSEEIADLLKGSRRTAEVLPELEDAAKTIDDVSTKPLCPKCGDDSKMFKDGDEWVCHNTHVLPEAPTDNPVIKSEET